VFERDHTLILGYHPTKLLCILQEIHYANLNNQTAQYRDRNSAAIVILSPEDKETVERLIQDKFGSLHELRVVVRQGEPSTPSELRKVPPARVTSPVSRSIVFFCCSSLESTGGRGARPQHHRASTGSMFPSSPLCRCYGI
jgi:hypothetical protein